jgi:hypothetical protein
MIPAFKNLPPPPGYVDRYRFNSPLIISGGVTFGTTYLVSIVRGATDGFKNGMGGLAVPLIGPWLAIANRKIDCNVTVSSGAGDINDSIDDSTNDATKCFAKEAATIAVMTGLGIGQLIGATLLAAGLIDRRHYYLRSDLATLSIQPAFDLQNLGLVVRGTL